MSSITSLTSNGYYSLNNQSSHDANASAAASAVPSLATALSQVSAKPSSADSSYSLDLSPTALAYIKQLNAQSTGTTSVNSNKVTGYALNRAQQQTVNEILAKYKDAPFTQETFEKIQDDLKTAGLGEDVLAAQDKARNFNATQFLLDALNGTSSEDMTLNSLTGKASGDEEATYKAKSANFMTSVADAWARISTTAQDAKSD